MMKPETESRIADAASHTTFKGDPKREGFVILSTGINGRKQHSHSRLPHVCKWRDHDGKRSVVNGGKHCHFVLASRVADVKNRACLWRRATALTLGSSARWSVVSTKVSRFY